MFSETTFQDCVLGPGDALYIPRHCWHWVAAIDQRTALSFRHSNRRACSSHFEEDGDNITGSRNSSIDEVGSFSFSVNFWWGNRIVKQE